MSRVKVATLTVTFVGVCAIGLLLWSPEVAEYRAPRPQMWDSAVKAEDEPVASRNVWPNGRVVRATAAGDVGVEGAVIVAQAELEAERMWAGRSGEGGWFRIATTLHGACIVRALTESGWAAEVSTTLDDAGPEEIVTVRLRAPWCVRGRVIDARDQSAIGGARVWIELADDACQNALETAALEDDLLGVSSNDAGEFTLPVPMFALPATVRATADGMSTDAVDVPATLSDERLRVSVQGVYRSRQSVIRNSRMP